MSAPPQAAAVVVEKQEQQQKQQKQPKKKKEQKKGDKFKQNVVKALPAHVVERVKVWDTVAAEQKSVVPAVEEKIVITLPDGATKEGIAFVTTPMDIATGISPALSQRICGAKIDGVMVDLTRPIEKSCTLELVDFSTEEGQKLFWHSSAHILGQAIELTFPDAKLCIGPPIDDGGFYYDVSLSDGQTITPADLLEIKKAVSKVQKEKQPFQRLVLTKPQALDMFKDNKFKKMIITDKIPDDGICTAYRCGPLIDLCRGPHVPHTGKIKAFELLKSSSAYWLGDANSDVLQRVYGISFPNTKLMKEYKIMIEEAKKRDHRVLGEKQKLFFFDDISPGSCFMLPHGTRIYNKLQSFIKDEYKKRGYDEVITPNVFNVNLWKQSGHYAHYKEHMFTFECEKQEFAMKPMNCPGHCVMFNHHLHSYRDLPIRYADFGVLHRNENSGSLTGLTRVRRFQQDDAHIFCRHDQIQQEVGSVLDMLKYCYGKFGFTFELQLSTRPKKYMGRIDVWDNAELQLAQCLNDFGFEWTINAEDGAFYGPKIDIKLFDALKRKHQCATIQLDFQLPERFNLKFNAAIETVHKKKEEDISIKDFLKDDPENNKKNELEIQKEKEEKKKEEKQKLESVSGLDAQFGRPVIIHRAILGSVERMMAVLIEHTGGKWPLWLSPRQAMVIPVAAPFFEYAQQVADTFAKAGFYVDAELSNKQLKKKVREAQVSQYNFIFVVGAAEAESQSVNIRFRDVPDKQELFSIEGAIEMMQTLKNNFE